MVATRHPAVSGLFYPAEAKELSALVTEYLEHAGPAPTVPKAIIAPHAGYVYSGPVAASAYAALAPARRRIKRVVLVGPAHRVAFNGLALSSCEAFETPLGLVPVDQAACAGLSSLPGVSIYDGAHSGEHSLEVHLPFLQKVIDDFSIVPLVIGSASAAEVGSVLERLWGGDETLLVVSSDLSHYHDYDTARRRDSTTSRAIEQLRWEQIDGDDACGYRGVAGLLWVAQKRGMTVATIDLRNSGDTAGPRDQVVGYGAYLVA
ncbi:MAG: AmmeMemoRadiSam system protein B [Acidobacteriota bacterium]|nr:MAG: AmmeMemoRadiSam system protein B [Acidobacteriota bacterium]